MLELAFEALLTMRQCRYPHMCKVFADDKVGGVNAVGINRHIVRIGFNCVGRGTSLDTTEMKVGLVINAPHFISDE